MRPALRFVVAAAGLAVLALGILQLSYGAGGFFARRPAATVVTQQRIAAIKQAAAEFYELARGAATSGQPPRQSDPRVKPLLATVFDTSVLDHATSLGPRDTARLAEWARAANTAGAAYVFAGSGITDYANLAKLDPAAQRRLAQEIAANTMTFAPEIGRHMDAEMHITAAIIDGVEAEQRANPKKFDTASGRRGLDAMRAGFSNAIAGALEAIATVGLDDAWRRRRADALAAFTPAILAFFTPVERQSLHDRAEDVAAKVGDPAARGGLQSLAGRLGG